MFGFLKRKKREILSPVDGSAVSLDQVDDEVFSQRLAGEGVAIIPTDSLFCAPISGVVSKIFSTNHAYSIKSDKDLEVLVHIGLDTVNLKGQGFERLVEEGDKVEAGEGIIRVDLAYLKENAKDIITPVLITEESDVKEIAYRLTIVKTKDMVMEVQ